MEEIHDEAYHDDIGLLTQDDMAFIHETLGRDLLSVEEFNAVLSDGKLRSQVLDSPALLDALEKRRGSLCVSEYFYFTTVVRQVLLTAGLEAPQYTENVASSIVRMAGLRRKLLERSDSSVRYAPVDLRVLVEDGIYGSSLKICCKMPPYEMVLEGFLADVGAFGKKISGTILSPHGTAPDGNAA
jgi:hypothetical protein